LVDLRLMRSGRVVWAHLGGVMVGFSAFAQYIITFTLVTGPTHGGVGLGRSVAVAGAIQIPGAIALGASSMSASRWAGSVGLHGLLTGASGVVAAGFVLMAVRHGSVGEVVVAVCVVNLGLGVGFCTLPIIIMEQVDVEHIAAANAVNGLCRVVGSVVGSAVVAAVLATGTSNIAGAVVAADWTFVVSAGIAAAVAGALAIGAGIAGHRSG
jgi:hypothetical protein